VLPALAVGEELRTRGVHVTFAGPPGRIESRLVPEAGFELDTFAVSGLPRRPGAELARALVRAARAALACSRILARRRPDVVLGAGGFVAGPMVLAAAARRIPAALMEADARLGLANRLAAPFARRVFLAFPVPGREAGKYRVTGRPIPQRSRPVAREQARRLFGLPPEGDVLLVFGGSQGARSLNELALRSFGGAGPAVLHLAGEPGLEGLGERPARPGYRLLAFTDAFGAALSAADLVLARAGGSVFEVAAAGRPAVLVPYPYATGGHQDENARYFERAGGALVVPEGELERVPALVAELLADRERLREMGEAMRRAARPDAGETIAKELIALARARG
jgi:UDP-N-acetylglucosamine--N-acetylmuramyl-(pentapeptide) pyrophosphoryl-undecaprenol N-acetylglucosamine transferase